MDENHPMHPKKRILAFRYAFEGLTAAFKQEPNLKLHLFIFIIAILVSIYMKINPTQWILVIMVSGMVFAVEMTNTAIEAVVDSFTDKQHPGAKLSKDISAGAVLIAAITAAIVGLIIFVPYITSSSLRGT